MESKVEIIMIGDEYCPNCAECKEMIKAELKSGRAVYHEYESPEGQKYVKQYHIGMIPGFIVLQKNGEWKRRFLYTSESELGYAFKAR